MKRFLTGTIRTSVIVFLLAGALAWPEPAMAGVSEWSAEDTPSELNSVLGPAGIDIRDYAIGNDAKTIYAVTGNSTAGPPYYIYKSTNSGVTWTKTSTGNQKADLIAVAPDDKNLVVYADNTTNVFLSIDGGASWNSIGVLPGSISIRDIAISPSLSGVHYVAAAGSTTLNAELWYFPWGNPIPAWQTTSGKTGFSTETEMVTLAFSSSFVSDTAVVTVTGNNTTGVNIQVLNLGSLLWNTSASYNGFPCPVVTANISAISSASLALAPTYDGTDEDSRNLFISLTLDGDVANSGIYRLKNTVKSTLLASTQIHSLAYNGNYLIAGSYADTTVNRITSPMGTTWSLNTYTYNATRKTPGGDNRVLVGYMGNTVAAATCGMESAFSVSNNYGGAFNDISLIDTTLDNAEDVAVTSNAGKVYYVTDKGINTSVWYRSSSTWTRILSLRNTPDCFVRAERASGNVVYVARKGAVSPDIYINASSGSAQWQTRTGTFNVQDITVESSSIAYILSNDGRVVKTSNAGQIWNAPVATTLASGNMLCYISTGKILAASQNGYIAYSSDSGATWTQIPKQFSGAGVMQVVADQNFNVNKTIYAASATPGTDIKKWQIDTSTEWTDIFNGVVPGGIYGLVIDTNTLYALETNAGQSQIWRYINPLNATATSTDWIGIGVTPTTDPADIPFTLNAAPQALKASTNKLWAVKTNVTNKLYSFTDSVANLSITLGSPANGFLCRMNPKSGIAYDVNLSWLRPSVATEYQIQVALDRDFMMMVTTFSANTTNVNVNATIGPTQTGLQKIDFAPNTTYYWKVRVTKPGFSLFSEIRSFSVENLPPSPKGVLTLLGPPNASLLTTNTPAFSWSPIQGADEYEFLLSENPDMSTPLLNAKTDTTSIKILRKLEWGKTYFWWVRASSPILTEWSTAGNFILAEEIIIPTTKPAATPTLTVILPAETQSQVFAPPVEYTTKTVVPNYLVIAILIGLAFIGVLVFLILRQPSRARIPNEYIGPVRKPTPAPKQPTVPIEKPAVTEQKLLSPLETPAAVLPGTAESAKKPATKPPAKKSKDAETVIFAAKSFDWISGPEKDTTTAKERVALGKKLAGRIRNLAKVEPIYIKHPEDAAMLLTFWARYSSREETDKYLANSFKDRPENAVRLLRCFMPQGAAPEEAEIFTKDSYLALEGVIDTEKVYTALTRSSKFKFGVAKEPVRINPADSNLIARFSRLYLQSKNQE